MPLPWQRLLDAQLECQESERGADEQRQRRALEELDAAREEMGCVGGLLILMALEYGGITVQRKLSRVFGGVAADAFNRAVAAEQRVAHALGMIDVLKAKVAELEKRTCVGRER